MSDLFTSRLIFAKEGTNEKIVELLIDNPYNKNPYYKLFIFGNQVLKTTDAKTIVDAILRLSEIDLRGLDELSLYLLINPTCVKSDLTISEYNHLLIKLLRVDPFY